VSQKAAALLLFGSALFAQEAVVPAVSEPSQAAVPAAATDVPAPQAAAPPAPVVPPIEAKKPVVLLDKGLLDSTWFGPEVQFAKGEDVDFYWIKPGLDLAGRTIQMKPWEDPQFLQKGRDAKDNAKATALTDTLPATIRGALSGTFNGKVKVTRGDGDVECLGRIVDCNAGSTAAKFLIGLGAGQENVTFDLKMLDATTKELLLAVHHRTISGTYLSNMESKLVKWSEKFGQFMLRGAIK
jgi:hypothetical protein